MARLWYALTLLLSRIMGRDILYVVSGKVHIERIEK
jgi:hypothetical protein